MLSDESWASNPMTALTIASTACVLRAWQLRTAATVLQVITRFQDEKYVHASMGISLSML